MSYIKCPLPFITKYHMYCEKKRLQWHLQYTIPNPQLSFFTVDWCNTQRHYETCQTDTTCDHVKVRDQGRDSKQGFKHWWYTLLNNSFPIHITLYKFPNDMCILDYGTLFIRIWWLWKQQCNIQSNDDVSLLLTFQVWMTEQRRGGWVESSYCRGNCPARQKWVHKPLWGRGGILQRLIAPDIGFSCSFSLLYNIRSLLFSLVRRDRKATRVRCGLQNNIFQYYCWKAAVDGGKERTFVVRGVWWFGRK